MSHMDEFEQELSKRLRRVDAPASLAETVVRRVAEEPRRTVAFPQGDVWIGRLAALLLLTAMIAGAGVTGIHHRRAAERAKAERDFARSQELIGRALEPVRQHLRQAGVSLEE